MESDFDKRNKVISFTKEGKKFAEDMISKAKDAEYNALSFMGEDKVKALIEVMTIYKDNLRIE